MPRKPGMLTDSAAPNRCTTMRVRRFTLLPIQGANGRDQDLGFTRPRDLACWRLQTFLKFLGALVELVLSYGERMPYNNVVSNFRATIAQHRSI